jgi:NADPH2:quinone reductase
MCTLLVRAFLAPARRSYVIPNLEIGSNVQEFKLGDRVASTNHGGGFAEYAVGPGFTTYLLPDHVSFEGLSTVLYTLFSILLRLTSLIEAVSYGLGYLTAALNLYKELRLAEPWNPATETTPLVIYGAASTVGAFAVKLARLSNVHPIIAVAGRGIDFVSSLLDSSKGDVVIDYRKGSEYVLSEIQRSAPKVQNVLDAISTPETISLLSSIPDPVNRQLSLVLPPEAPTVNPGIKVTVSFAPLLWEPNDPSGPDGEVTPNIVPKAFAHIMFRYLAHAQANYLISHHPYEVILGGLEGISRGLKNLRDGQNSARKYILRIT